MTAAKTGGLLEINRRDSAERRLSGTFDGQLTAGHIRALAAVLDENKITDGALVYFDRVYDGPQGRIAATTVLVIDRRA